MNSILTDYGSIKLDVISSFENSLHISFPESYVKLISEHDGLQFIANYFNYVDLDDIIKEGSFGFCGYGETVIERIEKFQDHDVYGHEKIVVFGLRGNGDYICFDYRQNPTTDNPPVVLMYHDQYVNDEHGQPKMAIVKIADDFDSFIDMLHE